MAGSCGTKVQSQAYPKQNFTAVPMVRLLEFNSRSLVRKMAKREIPRRFSRSEKAVNPGGKPLRRCAGLGVGSADLEARSLIRDRCGVLWPNSPAKILAGTSQVATRDLVDRKTPRVRC